MDDFNTGKRRESNDLPESKQRHLYFDKDDDYEEV